MRKFISYGKQWIDDDDIEAVVQVLKSDYLTQGPRIEEFEKAICEYTGAKYCIAVANGTAALHIAVAALNIQRGKEGITSPNSFVASANCLVYNELIPRFADIDPKTYNIDIYNIGKRITKNTKIIIPIHFAGQPVDMEELYKISKVKGLHVIEDAAHAIGSKYKDGSPVGNCRYSDMTIFSFHPVKTITTGEGGVITTNSIQLYEQLKLLRTHGITKDADKLSQDPGPWYYEMHDLGFNYRMTDIQAALGISQLRMLDRFVKRRREIVNRYNEAFKDVGWLEIPCEKESVYSAFHLYVLQIDFEKIKKSRKDIMEELRNNAIGTQVHYIPIHLQPFYKNKFEYQIGDFPNAENYYKKALTIPLYAKMEDDDIEYVIEAVIHILE